MAISGLHIGLLMLLFRFLLWPLRLLPKGDLHLSLTVITLLWGYAFFVGASPSVLRYTFSAIQLGHAVQRKLPTAPPPPLFGLTFYGNSTFRFAPSYPPTGFSTELFGRLWDLISSPHFSIEHQLFTTALVLELLTLVSLAAQIAVAPLSIYHFQQFPALFVEQLGGLAPNGAFLYLGFGSVIWLLFSPLPQACKAFRQQRKSIESICSMGQPTRSLFFL